VYAALFVIPAARLAYELIVRFGTVGVIVDIAGCALALIIVGGFAWRSRRRISDWAAKEPPPWMSR
jgi:hypothetical protein